MKNFLPCKRPKAERLSLDTLRFSDNGNEIFFNGDMKILELFSVAAIGHHRRNFPIKREPSSSLEWPSVRKVARQCKDPATGSLLPKTFERPRQSGKRLTPRGKKITTTN